MSRFHRLSVAKVERETRDAVAITFAVPQVREGGFYPQALEKGLRSERALMLALAEMYVQGVSTRKVKAVTEELCGHAFSASTVSTLNARLDEELARVLPVLRHAVTLGVPVSVDTSRPEVMSAALDWSIASLVSQPRRRVAA